MQRAPSSLLHVSPWQHSLKTRSYSGVSRLLPISASLTLSRLCRLPLFVPQGWTKATHWMRSKMYNPNMSMAMNSSHTIPCNATESERMLVASEGQDKETFIVRRATSLDDLQWVIRKATEEGWMPREKEAECYFSAGLTPDFFIGELNGERVTSLCAVGHEGSYTFASLLTVLKQYRGQGYGQKTWDTVVASLGDQYNIHGAAVSNIKDAHAYMKHPTMPGWISRRYAFDALLARNALASSQSPSSLAKILPAGQADFKKLFAYSADMLGTSQVCRLVLAAWLSHTQESSWVAIGNTGQVVGYLIMSKTTRFPEEGYYIAPFYADSAAIARSLLKVAVDFAAGHNPGHIFLDIAVHLNPEGVSILEKELGAKQLTDLVLFGTPNGIPSKPQYKVFGAASLDVL